ncbi:hypothetical protein [Synechococcus sp. RS9902]|uniref:hypothetical protein n=1 Tax=Synechococcus sp. RS9902 TaxID=221345 RepID=UPI002104C09A|nr:hypothetical protein [Synechococcus sp. RS9902]
MPEVLPVIVAASSTLVMVRAAELKEVDPPAASVVVAVTRTAWPTRDWAEVSSCCLVSPFRSVQVTPLSLLDCHW